MKTLTPQVPFMEFWEGKTVAVPGGAGFIGSYLVEHLVAAGARVTVIDNLESGRLANLEAVSRIITFIQADVSDADFCRRVFAGQEVVMNLAARAPGVGYSQQRHESLLGRNLLIGSAVLEGARQARTRRLLVVSSSCVYPEDAPVPTPELPLFTGVPEQVNTGYGWAKRYLELQARHYAARFGLEIAIARPFNTYGARDLTTGEQAHVIPALIERLYSPAPELTVWGSGRQTRSFIHARDVAVGLMLLTARHAVADPVNLGNDQEVSIRDLVHLLMELAGVQKRVVFDTGKPEGCLRKAADMSKFQRVTQTALPHTELREGLREMLAAHDRRLFRAAGAASPI